MMAVDAKAVMILRPVTSLTELWKLPLASALLKAEAAV